MHTSDYECSVKVRFVPQRGLVDSRVLASNEAGIFLAITLPIGEVAGMVSTARIGRAHSDRACSARSTARRIITAMPVNAGEAALWEREADRVSFQRCLVCEMRK